MGQEFNVIVQNDNLESNVDLFKHLFGEDEGFVGVGPDEDMFDILVMFGLFRSKGEARKNWKRTGREIPEGFTDIERIGKLKHRLTIWNPVK